MLTSRNVSGTGMSTFMSGLNHQIEHHLFPSMPRPHLRRARRMVRETCAREGIPYTETGIVQAWSIVQQYMNRVGLQAGASFQCPVIVTYGRL